jgi:hypothetical protein
LLYLGGGDCGSIAEGIEVMKRHSAGTQARQAGEPPAGISADSQADAQHLCPKDRLIVLQSLELRSDHVLDYN